MINSKILAGLALAALVAGCGGGSGSNSDAGTGSLSLQITDAPVDGVTGVTVEFAGITVKPKAGAPLAFPFDIPLSVDLAQLTGDNTATLLSDQPLPAGEYNWIRLDVNADCDAVFESYVDTESGGMVELAVPSARGLQLGNGFVITANRSTSFVVDWDLRMGLNDPMGDACYKLKPSLRIIDLTEWGSIAGTVDPALIGGDPNTLAGNVVYVYQGADVPPDDIDGLDAEPVTTANVRFNASTSQYEFLAAFLSPGVYTVAFTAEGQHDAVPDPDMPGADTDEDITFTAGQNVTVVDGQTSAAAF